MPRGRPRRQPSGRNLELYHELVCEGRLQAEVAARFRVSQPRVAQLRRQIAAWVESSLPADIPTHLWFAARPTATQTAARPGDAGQRLHLAIALRRLQLEVAYGKYLDHFGGVRGAAAYGHLVAASAAGVLPKDVAARLPRRDLVQSAVRMARELDDLARVARRGPFFHFPDQLQELGRQSHTPAAQAREVAHKPDARARGGDATSDQSLAGAAGLYSVTSPAFPNSLAPEPT